MLVKKSREVETSIDLHAKAAAQSFGLGAIVSILYYILSKELAIENSLWEVTLFVQTLASLILLAHYFFNRKSRRLWIDGVISPIILTPFFMMGLVWVFYLAYVPIPKAIRVGLYLICLGVIARHALLVFSDFRRAARMNSVIQTIYRDSGGGELVYRDSINSYVDSLTSRTPFKKPLMVIVNFITPFAAAFGISVNHFSSPINPIYIVCLVLSFLGFPLTAWIIGNGCVRSLYFKVYLPLKLERKTGRKIVLGAG